MDRAIRLKYVTLITHGGMLSVERAVSLRDAGINQFSISLDYLDGRHDIARGIPGLTDKIFNAVAGMRERGIDNIRFNTVIKDDNLDQLMPIVERASSLGCGVNFSVYTDAKNGNRDHLVTSTLHDELDDVIARLLAYKRRRRGVITSSDAYLEASSPSRAAPVSAPSISIRPAASSVVPTSPRTFTGATSSATSPSTATRASTRAVARHRRRSASPACAT